MRILIDTNILISALFYPKSKPFRALYHVAENHELVLSDHNISELHRIVKEKFSAKQADVNLFLTELSYELIPSVEKAKKLMRDPKDQPILNAALTYDVDVILTGDKDFLEMDLEHPKLMTAAQFLESEEVQQ